MITFLFLFLIFFFIYLLYVFFFFFFFFQAEDGIRDTSVTGVQTCALPIFATRVARYHNVYGPHGTWTGGREKAPAAICRKVIQAKLSGQHDIEIWRSEERRVGKECRCRWWTEE